MKLRVTTRDDLDLKTHDPTYLTETHPDQIYEGVTPLDTRQGTTINDTVRRG